MDKYKIKHLLYWWKCKNSGLVWNKKTKKELAANPYQFGSLGDWFRTSYTPKQNELIIPTLRKLNQKGSMCCQWYAGLVQKEKDEEVKLSIEALVTTARTMGLTGEEGSSALGSSQEVFRKVGVPEDELVADVDPNNYEKFSTVSISQEAKSNAEKHKEKTHWVVNNRNDAIRLLDEGHILEAGLIWRTAYNNGGSRPDYYYIRDKAGYSVGGHAIAIIGYNISKNWFVYQNSYGENWGANGCGYIDIDWYFRNGFGLIVSLDIPQDKELTAEDIKNMEGQNVKGNKEPAIYKIIEGQKCVYKSDRAFVAHNGIPYTYKNAFTVVKQEELDKIELGYGILSETNGKYSDVVNNLKQPVNDNFIPNK